MRLLLFLVYFHAIVALVFLGTVASDEDDQAIYDLNYIQVGCYPVSLETLYPGIVDRKYGIILADVDNCYDDNKNCSILLNTSADYFLTVRFYSIAIDCYDDRLTIIGQTNSESYCGYGVPAGSLYSSSNWLRFQFVTGSYYSGCLSGFKLYYTAYHLGSCSDDEFQCSLDGRCIPDETKCDGFDNCGDWSDERTAACGLSTGAIIAISVTCALIGISLIALIGYCAYDRSRHKPRRTTGARGAIDTVNDPIAPPRYVEPPPAYTYVNTVYAGLYEDSEPNPNAPPSYDSLKSDP